MKRIYLFFVSLLIFGFSTSYSQYNMSLENDTQTASNVYEFDIYINSTSGSINLTSYQISLTFNTSIANGGVLSFSYISSSSSLSNVPSNNNQIVNDGTNTSLFAASGPPSSDMISTTPVKVGRFRLSNTVDFANLTPNINWDFSGAIQTEINIDNSPATVPGNHSSSLSNPALPVELLSFTSSVVFNNVNLSWETATEVNNNGFEVQRKNGLPNSSWTKIGFIEGHGNSNSPKDYKFVDKNLTGGTKFLYRLKQIDNDGKFQYSKEVEVEVVPKQYTLYQNYPNPFNPSTTIKFDLPQAAEVNLTVYNILGEKVITLINGMQEAGYHSVIFNASNLASGTYIYILTASNFVQTRKMMLVK